MLSRIYNIVHNLPLPPHRALPLNTLAQLGEIRALRSGKSKSSGGHHEYPFTLETDALLVGRAELLDADAFLGADKADTAATVSTVVLTRHIGIDLVEGKLAALARAHHTVGRP